MSVIEAPARTTGAPLEVVVPVTPPEAQILELAADILEREGWCRRNFSAFGNRCAVGGIGAATKRMRFAYGEKAKSRARAEKALADLVRESNLPIYIQVRSPERFDRDTITVWNDWYANGKEQVVRKMREAAARLTPSL